MTIVMPTLNQVGHIERSLDSVLAQARDFVLELIVVDGGSTDGTLDVLADYGDQVRWTSGPDRGQSHALNRGLAMARGSVLGWLNSDDTYERGGLQLVMDTFRAEPDTQWVYGKVRIIDEEDREIRRWVTSYKNMRMHHLTYGKLLRENMISQMGVFWRRAAYAAIGPFREELHLAMDYDYWLRLAGRWPGRFIDANLANFRWYSSSKSGSRFREQFSEELSVAAHHAGAGHSLSLAVHRLYAARTVAAYRLMRLLQI